MRVFFVVSLIHAARAWAIDDCVAGARHVDLNNGASTADYTGIVRCCVREGLTTTFDREGVKDGTVSARRRSAAARVVPRGEVAGPAAVVLRRRQARRRLAVGTGRVTTRERWDADGGLIEDEAFYEDGSRKKKKP